MRYAGSIAIAHGIVLWRGTCLCCDCGHSLDNSRSEIKVKSDYDGVTYTLEHVRESSLVAA